MVTWGLSAAQRRLTEHSAIPIGENKHIETLLFVALFEDISEPNTSWLER